MIRQRETWVLSKYPSGKIVNYSDHSELVSPGLVVVVEN
jgi:hypothetical protein